MSPCPQEHGFCRTDAVLSRKDGVYSGRAVKYATACPDVVSLIVWLLPRTKGAEDLDPLWTTDEMDLLALLGWEALSYSLFICASNYPVFLSSASSYELWHVLPFHFRLFTSPVSSMKPYDTSNTPFLSCFFLQVLLVSSFPGRCKYPQCCFSIC